MEFTLIDICILLFVGWGVRHFINFVNGGMVGPAGKYVLERIEGMEFEFKQIDGIWYCWILEDEVYIFVGQGHDRLAVEDACKKRVYDMCFRGLKGLTN